MTNMVCHIDAKTEEVTRRLTEAKGRIEELKKELKEANQVMVLRTETIRQSGNQRNKFRIRQKRPRVN